MLLEKLKRAAGRLRTETYALYLAARHPATPWYARLIVTAVVAYAFSPIDLIPDFIPVLGYLDDLILVPLGIAIAIRLVPVAVMHECRTRAASSLQGRTPVSRTAGMVVVLVWVTAALLCLVWAYEAIQG